MIFRALFFLATLFALALAAWSLLAEPPPLPVATLGVFAYVALVYFALFVRRDIFADGWVSGPAGARGLLLVLEDDPSLLAAAEARTLPATVLVASDATTEHLKALRDRGFSLAIGIGPRDRLGLFQGPTAVREALEPILTRAEAAEIPLEAVLPPLATPALGRAVAKLGLVALLPRYVFEVQPRRRLQKRLPSLLRDGCILQLRTHISPRSASEGAIAEVVEAAAAKQLPFARLEEWIAKV